MYQINAQLVLAIRKAFSNVEQMPVKVKRNKSSIGPSYLICDLSWKT